MVLTQDINLLLLSVSSGAGHKRAAEALLVMNNVDAVDRDEKIRINVIHLDVMDFVTWVMRKIYTDFYIGLVNKTPTVWGILYRLTNAANSDGVMQGFRRWIERKNSHKLRNKLEILRPDVIICTHFLPAEILSRLISAGKLSCPVWVQVTDFDLHQMWLQKHMAGYFAANVEVADRLSKNGISPEMIHVTGIPIMPGFSDKLDRHECAAKIGVDPEKRCFLLMGGGAGVGNLEQVAERLMQCEGDFQLIVLAGKNLLSLEKLWTLQSRYPKRLFPQGFTNQVEILMACSDLAITKPGGLTSSECLAMGLPMILNTPIPGQEEHNADFLLEQGVAMKAFDLTSLAYRVEYLLDHPEQLAQMRTKARLIGRPHAARTVLKEVIDTLLSNENKRMENEQS
jgi:processive 1,2-diacylglycerol beta-glucosyltransferase